MFFKVGLRTIKTAISSLICLGLYLLIRLIPTLGTISRDGITMELNGVLIANTLYNPFFAAIATAYSVAPDKKRSISQAKTRCVASLIGGFVGILLLLIVTFIARETLHLNGGEWTWPNLFDETNTTIDFIVPYILVAIFSIVVVRVGILVKQPNAIFVAILTFLSITVNPTTKIVRTYGELLFGTDYAGTFIFGLNRILSTIIGVLIALGVNLYSIPYKNKNKNLLFCMGIEGILQNETDTIKGFMNYQLNHMAHIGANCTLFTTRTPTTFMHLLNDVEIRHPIICSSGAALYDAKKLKYLYKEEIPLEVEKKLDEYLKNMNVTPFKNYIVDDVLYIYVKNIDNTGERLYYESKKNAPYCTVSTSHEPEQDVLYYLLVERIDIANKIVEEITNGELKDDVIVQVYDYFDNSIIVPELKYIKLYSKKVLELNCLKEYAKANNFNTVGLTTNKLSNHLLRNCDYSVTVRSNLCDSEAVDIVLESSSYDSIFKQMKKMYYDKKYKQESQVIKDE